MTHEIPQKVCLFSSFSPYRHARLPRQWYSSADDMEFSGFSFPRHAACGAHTIYLYVYFCISDLSSGFGFFSVLFFSFQEKQTKKKIRSGAVAMPPPFLFHRGTLPLKLLRVVHWKLAVQSLAGKVAPWCFDFDLFFFFALSPGVLDRLREPTLHQMMQCWGKTRGVWCQEYGSVLAPLDLAALEHMLLHFIWRIYIGVIVLFFFFSALFDTVALRPVTSPR